MFGYCSKELSGSSVCAHVDAMMLLQNQAGLHAEGVQMLNQTAGQQQQQQSGNSSGSRASPTRLPAYSALWESSGQGENGAAASSATVVPQALNILVGEAERAAGGPSCVTPC